MERGRLHVVPVWPYFTASLPFTLSELIRYCFCIARRDPIVPFVNYFYTHKGTGGPGKSQTRRAAELVRATDVFRDLVESCVLSSSCSHVLLRSDGRFRWVILFGLLQQATRARAGEDDALGHGLV